MTDVSRTTQAVRQFKLPRLGFASLNIGARLAAISALLSDACRMAYVDPYAGQSRRAPAAPDDHLEGRDPDW